MTIMIWPADNTALDVRFYSQNLPTSSGEWGQIGLGSLGSISVSLWGTVKIKIKDFREVLTVYRGMIDDPLMTTSLTPLEPPLQSYWDPCT